MEEEIDQDIVIAFTVASLTTGAVGYMVFFALYTGIPSEINMAIQTQFPASITNEVTLMVGGLSTALVILGAYTFFATRKKSKKTIRILAEEPYPDPIVSDVVFEEPTAIIDNRGEMSFEELMRKQKEAYYNQNNTTIHDKLNTYFEGAGYRSGQIEEDIKTVNFFFERGKQEQEHLFNLPCVSYIAAQDIGNLRTVLDRADNTTLAYKVGHTDPPKKGMKIPFVGGKKKSLWDNVGDDVPKVMESEGDTLLRDKIRGKQL